MALRKNDVSERLLEEIKSLKVEVTELRGEREANRDAVKLQGQISDLQKKLTKLQIDYDREAEKHSREKREVEHMVGLEKKRQEFEVDAAKRDVTLTVREENLKEDRSRFEKEMEYTRTRFEEEVGRIEGLTKQILKRLPTVSVEKAIDLTLNGNGNGHKEEVEA